MDSGDVRIPKYVVKTLAEKLSSFIEDQEKSFKFHPWQVSSTLNEIQKSIHCGLPERAIHHLHDTGVADEILKFSNENDNSIKIGRVKEYLYSCLGLNGCKQKSQYEKSCQIVYQESQTYDALRRNRIFEIRRLVDAIVQQLEQTGKLNENVCHLQPYNWKKLSYPLQVAKRQTLARCKYSCCLFHGNEDRVEKKKKVIMRKQNRKQQNFIKKNIRTAVPKITYTNTIVPNSIRKSASAVPYFASRNRLQLGKAKKMIESTTQTNSWSLRTPPRESLLEGTIIDVSNSDLTFDSEDDFYCKSDTLNDASMITEEVASEFITVPDIASDRRPRRLSNSTRSSIQSKFKDSVSVPEHASKTTSSVSIPDYVTKTNGSVSVPDHVTKTACSINNLTSKESEATVNGGAIYSKSFKRASLSRCKISIQEELNEQDGEHQDAIQNPDFQTEDNVETSMKDIKGDNSAENQVENEISTEISNISLKDNNSPSAHESLIENVEEKAVSLAESENGDSLKLVADDNVEAVVSSDNETTYSPRSLSECTECDSDISSSIKENDNMSLEYSSHWTAEYSSTEASDSEDEGFKKQFTDYKRTLLEEDEGIAASCEDEISNGTETKEIEKDEGIAASCEDEISLNADAQLTEQPRNSDEESDTKGLLNVLALQGTHIFEDLNTLDENVLEIVDEDGWNMLHLAASRGLDSFVENLLQHGLAVESVTGNGYTALQLAITNNHLKCCQILLKHGASLAMDDGSFDDSFMDGISHLSSPIKSLLGNYRDIYTKVQKIVEVLNQFGRHKKDISGPFSKNLLQAIADVTIEGSENDRTLDGQ